MTRANFDQFTGAVQLIGARWSGAILQALLAERRRYCQIRSAVPGVSDTMLAKRLRELEEWGLVERRVMQGHPIGTEYRLTDMGRELQPVLQAITTWSNQWSPVIEQLQSEKRGGRARRSFAVRSEARVAQT